MYQRYKTTMVSLTSILAMVSLFATTVDYVEAHGYIKEPPCTWLDSENSEWTVEISAAWEGAWEKCRNDEELLAMFKKLGAVNNYKDVRTLMDGNPLYGKDCGYTNPRAKPVAPPSNKKAIFSRPIAHAGPCAIYLDNELVFQSDDCQSSNHDGIFEVDYLTCAPSGCMMRFYWLALQRLNGKMLWQAYKNCIPLTGPPGGGGAEDASQEELSDVSQEKLSGNSKNTTGIKSKDTPANEPKDSKDSKKDSNESKDSKKESNKPTDSKKESTNESKDSTKKNESKDSSVNKSNDLKKDSNESKESKANKSEDSPDSQSKKNSKETPPAGESSKTPKTPSNASPKTPKTPETPESPSNYSAETPKTPRAGDSYKTPSSSTSSPDTPAMTPAPGSKCKGHRRRRY